jgi:iron-sulfur cluster assembly protein
MSETKLQPLTLNSEAAEALEDYLENDRQENGLRIKIKGGGCAGFQYQLALDSPHEDDYIFESLGFQIIVDKESYEFVKGSNITYRNEISAQGFDVVNPQAEAACGCGSSFTLKDDPRGDVSGCTV